MYLKHFSKNENGKELFVANLRDVYQKKFYKRNKGDSCFWIENYYDSVRFRNKKTLEIAINKLVENNYDSIINTIKKEATIRDKTIINQILTFIFFAHHRSPGRRDELEQKLRFKNWYNSVTGNMGGEKYEGSIDKDVFLRELHLSQMIDDDEMKENVDSICRNLTCMDWTIVVAPQNKYWITSDDPCVEIKFNEDKTFTAAKPSNFDKLSSMYLPLTKKYCLLMELSDKVNEDIEIVFKKGSKEDVLLFNRFSFVTMSKLLVSPNEETYMDLALEIEKRTT